MKNLSIAFGVVLVVVLSAWLLSGNTNTDPAEPSEAPAAAAAETSSESPAPTEGNAKLPVPGAPTLTAGTRQPVAFKGPPATAPGEVRRDDNLDVVRERYLAFLDDAKLSKAKQEMLEQVLMDAQEEFELAEAQDYADFRSKTVEEPAQAATTVLRPLNEQTESRIREILTEDEWRLFRRKHHLLPAMFFTAQAFEYAGSN